MSCSPLIQCRLRINYHDHASVQNACGVSGGVNQRIAPRWLAGGATRNTGAVGGEKKGNFTEE
jgi:hypothetical protein